MGKAEIAILLNEGKVGVHRKLEKLNESELLELIGCVESVKIELISMHHEILKRKQGGTK